MLRLFSENYEGVATSYELNKAKAKKSGIGQLIAAKAYEELEEYNQALKIYEEMLGRYKAYDRAVKRSIHKPKLAPDLKEENLLAYTYYLMARVYTKMYLTSSEVNTESKRKEIKKRIKLYSLLSERANGPIVAIDELRFKVSQRDQVLEMEKFKTYYYAYLGFMTWQDQIKLVGSGNNIDILNTSEGSCAGFGVKTYNVDRLYGFDFCYMVGSTTSSSLMSNITYKQSGIATSGFFATFETGWQIFSDNLWIGPSIPVFYRQGDWSTPDGLEVRETSYIRTGLMLSTTWELGDFSFTSRFGKIFDNQSSHLQLLASYQF
jgi:tetratricopeptide (TPR) repeat protein